MAPHTAMPTAPPRLHDASDIASREIQKGKAIRVPIGETRARSSETSETGLIYKHGYNM
ncbi:MAG: hypothetical protein ACREE9_19855 [Stellaceae bacterium]